jgi:hypothetical protein
MAKRQRRVWPTFWNRWIGMFAIKILSDFHHRKPEVVYISGVNRHGQLVGKILNSSIMLWANPWQLVPYSPRLFDRLEAQYRLRQARDVVAHQTKLVKG